jgi:Tripartite tricarboxylate transporter family receptor
VPYRGAAPALNDLLGGQIPLIWASPVAVMPFVQQGKVKMLAVSTQQRDPMLPQVPAVSETGVPGFGADLASSLRQGCRRRSSRALAGLFVRLLSFQTCRSACRRWD